ncbi:MAG: phosphotransferase family protein [Haloarculaceae archaeon]
MSDREVDADALVDRAALQTLLADRLGPASSFAVERHTEGHSNETLFVTWGDRDLVLRRPPPGETADTAHDVLREHRVLDALQETAVPVPTTLFACEDDAGLGCECFVMERLAGDVVRETEPERFRTPAARERIGRELIETLVAVHEVDYAAVGLGDYGRPAGYLARQVDLWTDQLEGWLLPRTDRPVPGAEEVGDWLADNAPTEAAHALVHGDYKLDNVMFGPETPPDLVGVFDWEMSTLGDPLADLAYLLLYWRAGAGTPDLPGAVTPALTAREGYPTRADLVAQYERRTGLAFENRRFYRALAAYKLATASEAFYYRHLSGQADDPLYPEMEAVVPALIEHARRVIDGDRPLAR